MKTGGVHAMIESEPSGVDIHPGAVLGGKYRVDSVIGEGGMGVVLSARHVAMGNRLAIKVLRLEDENNPSEAVARFLREARAAARIQSEHVVRVTDVATLPDGTPYMVMEYLQGEDLRHVSETRGQLPVEEAVGYVLQACEGLAEAHASGVIHRDLKPSNLFLARKNNGEKLLKVLDFGISKVASRPGEVAITTTASLMGSPLYMSPEQMRSAKDVDARADIWSLGLILFELLAGTPAFEGDTIPMVCAAVMSGSPTPIETYRKDLPQGLIAVIRKCLSKQRDDRFPNMGALARALEPFGGGTASVHAERASTAIKSVRQLSSDAPPNSTLRSQGPLFSSPRRVSTPGADDPTRITPKKDGAKRLVLWLGAGVGAAAVAAVLGAGLASSTNEKQSTPAAPPAATESAPPVETSSAAAPMPPSTGAIVTIDSLPLVAADAGVTSVAHGATPRAPRIAPQAPSTTGSAAPSASSKEGWKWGDRN